MNPRRVGQRLVWCAALLTLAVPMAGCAGPRLGSRIFPQLAEEIEPEPEYVSGRLPLPSEQAVRPASVGLPPAGQYDPRTASAVRTRRSSGFMNIPRPTACFS
mgnify:CR=1 FL=1